MKISIIVAMAENRVIGANHQMPWHLPADLKRFKQITWGLPVVMGRNTHEAIGKPLPGRANIIVSRNPDYQALGCSVFNDPGSALAQAGGIADEVFIIGGAKLYETFLPLADILYVTDIKKAFAGDTFFPEWRRQDWLEVVREDISDDEAAGFDYSFLKYIRKPGEN